MVIGELARLWEGEGKRTVIVVHRIELLEQTMEVLRKSGVTPRVIASSYEGELG